MAESTRAINAQHVSAGGDNFFVAGSLVQLVAPATGLLSLHQLPPPVELVGRDQDLAELKRSIVCAEAFGATISAARAGLQGMGGVGKTALAVTLAHRLKDRYRDAQLFLNLRGADPEHRSPATPEEAMQSVIHSFRPEARLPDTLDQLTPIYRSILAEGGRRILILLDDAADGDQIRPLLPPPNCLLLVTSRRQFQLAGLETRNLDCLAPEKSRELLLKLAPRISPYVNEAARLCGHLPLALEVLAGVANDKSLYEVPELLGRLRARQDKLAPVDAAFQVSYELLSEDLRRRWTLLAVFPSSFDLRAAAAVWGDSMALTSPLLDPSQPSGTGAMPPDCARDAMQILIGANLVEWNKTSDRFRLHDLVREFCDSRISTADRDFGQCKHTLHYLDVATEADDLYMLGDENVVRGLELFDRERVHFEVAFERLQKRKAPDAATLLVDLVDTAAYSINLRFHPRQRIRWMEAQRDAARLTGNREAEGAALGNLGLAYAALGDAGRTIEFCEQALAINREIGERRGQEADLGNLGNAYATLGNPLKAISFYEQALHIAHEINDLRGQGNALGNLGNAYADLGDPRKAIGFYEEALVIDCKIGDSRSEATDLSNMGNAYADLGDLQKAVGFYQQALLIARRIGDLRGEGNALSNLGNAYLALGDTKGSAELYSERLAVARKIGDRRGEGKALGQLGLAYAALGDPRISIEFDEQALVVARELGDRRGESNALGNMGLTYAALGDARKAIEVQERRLAIVHEIGEPRGEANALWDSALVADLLGDRAKAIARSEAALRIYENINDPNTNKVRARLVGWRADPMGSGRIGA